jgi:hypothetical protein
MSNRNKRNETAIAALADETPFAVEHLYFAEETLKKILPAEQVIPTLQALCRAVHAEGGGQMMLDRVIAAFQQASLAQNHN